MTVDRYTILADAKQAIAEMQMLRNSNASVAASVGAAWQATGNFIMAGVAGIAASAGAVGLTALATKEYNSTLKQTQAIGRFTESQTGKLNESINELAKGYGIAQSNIAEASLALARAGRSASEIGDALEPVVMLSRAHNISMEEAAKMAVFATEAFRQQGHTYANLEETLDKMHTTAASAVLEIEDLRVAIQYAGSTSVLAGVSFDSLLALMGTMANSAMNLGIASRSVNRMMLQLIESADAAQQWADSFGLGIQIIKDGKLNIDEIITAFASLNNDIGFLQESMNFFSIRSMRAWGVLLNGADTYKDLLDKVADSQGSLSQATEIMLTSWEAIMGRIGAAFQAVLLDPEVQEALGGALRGLEAGLTSMAPQIQSLLVDLIGSFTDILPELMQMLTGFMDLAKTIIPVLLAFGKAVAGIPPGLIQLFVLFKMGQFLIMPMVNSLRYAHVAFVQLQASMAGFVYQSDVVAAKSAFLRQSFLHLAQAAAGVAMGMYMIVSGSTREARAMGALIATINAMTMAYILLSASMSAVNPMHAALAIGAATAVIGGMYAALGPMPEAPSIPMMETTPGTGGGVVTGRIAPAGIEGITHSVLVKLRPKEGVMSQEEMHELRADGGGGMNVDMRGAFVTTEAVEKLERLMDRRERYG